MNDPIRRLNGVDRHAPLGSACDDPFAVFGSPGRTVPFAGKWVGPFPTGNGPREGSKGLAEHPIEVPFRSFHPYLQKMKLMTAAKTDMAVPHIRRLRNSLLRSCLLYTSPSPRDS